MNRKHLIFFVIGIIVANPSFSQAQPQFIAAFGSGNVPPQTIGRYTPWSGDSSLNIGAAGSAGVGTVDQLAYKDKNNPMSTELYLKFESFKITYKIWSMLGEPVFDFLYRWDGLIGIGNVLFEEVKQWGLSSDKLEEISKLSDLKNFDKDLQERIKNISPLSVRFKFAISNKSFHIDAREVEIKELRYIDTRGFSKKGLQAQDESKGSVFLGLSEMIFSIDLPSSEGKWQTYSVPGSPNWNQLPTYFKTVFKNRENPADLFIQNIQIVEIRWPQYELKNIIREQYLRRLAKQNETQLSSADFWDKTPTKGSLPPSPIPESNRSDIEKLPKPLASDDLSQRSRYNQLLVVGKNPLSLSTPEFNKLSITLSEPLRGCTFSFRDSMNNEIKKFQTSSNIERYIIEATKGLNHIEILLEGESIGTIKWGYVDLASIVSLGFDAGFDGMTVKDGFVNLSGFVKAPSELLSKVKLIAKGYEQGVSVRSDGKFNSTVVLASGQNIIVLELLGVKQSIIVNLDRAPSQLRATLTWDRSGCDMDLFMISPAGSQCSYGNKNIDGMFLDVDNTRGFGPENIFVTQSKNGIYKIYVNAYSGSAEVTVTIFKNEQYYGKKSQYISRGEKVLFFEIQMLDKN